MNAKGSWVWCPRSALRQAGQHASGSKGIQIPCSDSNSGDFGAERLARLRPEILPLASAYAAKMVCSNVFIAKRDFDAVIRTDVQFREGSVANFMKIDVDTTNRRVEAALLGLFAKRYAAYAEGRGCTLVSKDEVPDRAAVPPLPPLAMPDALWPTGERVQLSENRRWPFQTT